MIKKTDKELVALLARWMKSKQPMDRHEIEKQLPTGLLNFAYCLGYNNPAKCIADFRSHSLPR